MSFLSVLRKRILYVSWSIKTSWTGYKMEPKLQDVITVERNVFTDESTLGEVRVDGDLICYSLEDTCRKGAKIAGSTAIPMGKYQVVMDHSERFGKEMPHLLNVPGFEGVRIHSGNTSKDTEGCILVGMRTGPNIIYDSKLAYDKLLTILKDRIAKGPTYIAVVGGGRDA